jgi:hypothetical protein
MKMAQDEDKKACYIRFPEQVKLRMDHQQERLGGITRNAFVTMSVVRYLEALEKEERELGERR